MLFLSFYIYYYIYVYVYTHTLHSNLRKPYIAKPNPDQF